MSDTVETAAPLQHSKAQVRRQLNPALRVSLRAVRIGPILILLLIALVMFIATPDFLTLSNFGNIGIQSSVVAILALGQFMVILTRGIDLSVGSIVSLTSVIGAMLFVGTGLGPVSILAMLLVGTGVGFINGFVFVQFKIPHPFIVTLGTLNVAAGVALLISSGSAILGAPEFAVWVGSGRVGGVPVAVLFTAFLALAAWFFTSRVQSGQWLYAMGGNPEGARRAGIPVNKMLIATYMLSGFFAACAAIVILGRTSSGYPTAGLGLELDSIAAVIIGGASFFGGRGNIGNVIVGALILGVLRNGLNLLNVSSFWQQVAIGVILVVAVGIDVLRTRIEAKIRTAEAKVLTA